MGISGDMTVGALFAIANKTAGFSEEDFFKEIDKLELDERVSLKIENALRKGISCTRFTIAVTDGPDAAKKGLDYGANEEEVLGEGEGGVEFAQNGLESNKAENGYEVYIAKKRILPEIEEIIYGSALDAAVKDTAMSIFYRLAKAEADIHNKDMNDILFPGADAVQAIINIVGVSVLLNIIEADKIVSAPINTGSGADVPAPVTAELLKFSRLFNDDNTSELTTSVGAAILATFAFYENAPEGRLLAVGRGGGDKEYERANVLTVLYIDDETDNDTIYEISSNIDNNTAEELGFAAESLMFLGALDVSFTPILMKKFRPGFMMSVLCKKNDLEDTIRNVFKFTAAAGVRYIAKERCVLSKETRIINTKYGDVAVKIFNKPDGEFAHFEYGDIARIAKMEDKSISEIRAELTKIYREILS